MKPAFPNTPIVSVQRQSDYAFIPFDPENTDYKELAKAVAKVLIEDYGQHNYKPFMQALIAELKQ